MKVKTSPCNPLGYLGTKEEINEYLNIAFMDDDPQVFLIALGHLAKKKGMIEVAKETDRIEPGKSVQVPVRRWKPQIFHHQQGHQGT